MSAYIWKEWQEAIRGKGFWLIFGLLAFLSVLQLLQSRALPADQGLRLYLLSLYEAEVYLVPVLALFFAALSVLQEKEQKTMLMLQAKRETPASFLWKKSVAVHAATLPAFVVLQIALVFPIKLLFVFAWPEFLHYLLATAALWLIFNQMGIAIGAACSNKMQLAGAALTIWFLFVFAADVAFLFVLPSVTAGNMALFSAMYFLDPLHTLHFYLETSFGFFPLEHMSRVMKNMVRLKPIGYLALDLAIWLPLAFAVAVGWGRRPEQG